MTEHTIDGYVVTHRPGVGYECPCASTRAVCSHIAEALRERETTT